MLNENCVISSDIKQSIARPAYQLISDNKPNSKCYTPNCDSVKVDCISCPSRSSCVVDVLSHDKKILFQSAIHYRKPIRKGKHLYWQNGQSRSIFIVRSGAIKTYKISKNGKERVLGFYLPGEVVGLDGLYKDQFTNSAVVLDTTTVCELYLNELSMLFAKVKRFQNQFLSIMYRQVLIEQKKHFLDSKTVEERVAAFILDLSNRYRQRKFSGITFQLQMIRRDIANFLGIAVESLSRALTRFQQWDWLEFNGHYLTIKNMDALIALSYDYKDELVF